jgi:sugar phosphate isomerase/epimerase
MWEPYRSIACWEVSGMVLYGIAAWNIKASLEQEQDRASYKLSTKLRTFKDMEFQAVSLHRYAPYPEEKEEFDLLREFSAVTIHLSCPVQDDELRQAIKIQRETGLVRWVSFDAALRQGFLDLECTARCLAQAYDLLSCEGIGILIENWMFSPEDFMLINDAVSRPGLGILLDIGHLNLFVRKSAIRADEYIDKLPLDIHEIHLHDNNGVEDLHFPISGRDGSVLEIMEDIINGLKKKHFDGIVTLEVIPHIQRIYIKDREAMKSIIRTRQIFEEYWNRLT